MSWPRNVDWNISPTEPGGNRYAWEDITRAILMDIREELRSLNGLLNCHNFVSFPATLRAIRQNTTPSFPATLRAIKRAKKKKARPKRKKT